MGSAGRDDFTLQTRRKLAERAAFRCTICRKATLAPSSDPEDSVSFGIAGHICAAAERGPRFDPRQTPEERCHISNGIWLCHVCSDIVDGDENRYTPEVLRDARTSHEEWLVTGAGIPHFPELKVDVHKGAPLHLFPPGTITVVDLAEWRYQTLSIRNRATIPIEAIRVRFQFPTHIARAPRRATAPVGRTIQFRPEFIAFAMVGTKDSAINHSNSWATHDVFVLECDILLPQEQIELVVSARRRSEPLSSDPSTCLENYAEGQFLYRDGQALFPRAFVTELGLDTATGGWRTGETHDASVAPSRMTRSSAARPISITVPPGGSAAVFGM